jgi:hypothetical protein
VRTGTQEQQHCQQQQQQLLSLDWAQVSFLLMSARADLRQRQEESKTSQVLVFGNRTQGISSSCGASSTMVSPHCQGLLTHSKAPSLWHKPAVHVMFVVVCRSGAAYWHYARCCWHLTAQGSLGGDGMNCWRVFLTQRFAQSAAAGAFPGVVVDALERYGEHAKAAYILFGKYEDEFEQPIAIKGKDLADIRLVPRPRGDV